MREREDLNSEPQTQEALNSTDSESMTCKQLFNNYGTPYKRASGMRKLQ